jgi:hypothetical protein
MIDQCSQFPILFTVGLIYLPPTVFHKTNVWPLRYQSKYFLNVTALSTMLLCRTRHQLGHHPTIMQLACRLLDVQALPKVEAYISDFFLKKKQQNELVNRCHGKSPSVGRVRVKF